MCGHRKTIVILTCVVTANCKLVFRRTLFEYLFGVLYRHVIMPKELVHLVPKEKLLSETEWRKIGVQQSEGWVHYMIHGPGKFLLICFVHLRTTP